MKIKKLVAHGVQGFLDFNITFQPELTFLIGINGSGKTTALKLMLGFLGPSYNYINQVTFNDLVLTCSATNISDEIKIIARRQDDNKLIITLVELDGTELSEEFDLMPKSEMFDELPRDERTRKYVLLNEKFDGSEVIQKIKELTTPIFLGLDRRLFKSPIDLHIYDTMAYRRRPTSRYPSNDPINKSLAEVQSLVFNYYRLIVPRQSQYSQNFKNGIFMKLFDFIDEKEIMPDPKKIEQIKEKKEEINLALKNLNIEGVDSKITSFFDKIEGTSKKLNDSINGKSKLNGNDEASLFKSLFINNSQLYRFDEIIKLSEEYQNNLTSLLQPLDRLKSIVFKFFKESKKELIIESNGELKIKLFNEDIANIFELSSGEKQILIMIAHLIFCEDQAKKEPGIFIVDEPELSLHLAWQQIFVDALIEASPNTQYILATHSPSIIANESRDKYCFDLSN